MRGDPRELIFWSRTFIVILAAMAVLTSDLALPATPDGPTVIDGPYASLLSSSADLGPSRADRLQITVALRGRTTPAALIGWARDRGLSVRWRQGQAWAVVEGSPADLAEAFDVTVHDFKGKQGQVFYASRLQPSIPAPVRVDVGALGRVLGYTPII